MSRGKPRREHAGAMSDTLLADSASAVSLMEKKLVYLEQKMLEQEEEQSAELNRYNSELAELKKFASSMEVVGRCTAAEHFAKRAEWTITDFSKRSADLSKGDSLWSPKFKAAGLDGMQLEFFPMGREKTTFDGFCSLFLWAPSGTTIKFQLWVGNSLRAPDEEVYNGRIAHGHSNFCPLAPHVDHATDSVQVGVDILDVQIKWEIGSQGLRLVSRSLEAMVSKEVEVIRNAGIVTAVWRIKHIHKHMEKLPRGASMWSPIFTAAGVREILLEFYPRGSTNTQNEGYCAFYIRAPEGVSMIVTLFVGAKRKGPILTTFDCVTGKGLPDFCKLEDQIDEHDTLELGIEVRNQSKTTLQIES